MEWIFTYCLALLCYLEHAGDSYDIILRVMNFFKQTKSHSKSFYLNRKLNPSQYYKARASRNRGI